jgi:hypothetical protein
MCFDSKLAGIGLSFMVSNQFGSVIGDAIIPSICKEQFHLFTIIGAKVNDSFTS